MISFSKSLLGMSIALFQPYPVSGFFVGVPNPMRLKSPSSSTWLCDSMDDNAEAAVSLPFSASDLRRLASLKSRHLTMPLLILDAIVPGQTVSFESDDPKFHNLVRFCLQRGESEIAMIGIHPHTGRPMNHGVTLPLHHGDVILDTRTDRLTVRVQGGRRLEVQGEPWLHHDGDGTAHQSRRDASFYMADVEIVDDRPEAPLPDDLAGVTQTLADRIPKLVATWVGHVVAHKGADALRPLETQLGQLPTEWKDLAFWVAALLNPTSFMAGEERLCLEIRPAMLSCRNDHERMILATAALQGSIDHITGERRLF